MAAPCEDPTNPRVEEGQNGKHPSLTHEEWYLAYGKLRGFVRTRPRK